MWCQVSVSDSGSNGNSEVLSVKKSDGRRRRRRRSTNSEEASRKIEPLPPKKSNVAGAFIVYCEIRLSGLTTCS